MGIRAALLGSTAGWLQQHLLTGIYLQPRGLAGGVCQKGQWVTGGVISRNVLVAHDSATVWSFEGAECEATGVLSIASPVSMRMCLC